MIGWYIVPYKQRLGQHWPTRYCAMDDYTEEIVESGGWWSETEVLGDRAIVKVRARRAVLNALDVVFKRLPKSRLDDSLADLSSKVKQAIKSELLDMGYSVSEILERLPGDLGDYTLRGVLRFMARRRLKPRYDSETDMIVLDGPVQECRSVESVDGEVTE